jgi:hypothetical protein
LVIACVLAIIGVFISSVDERWIKDIVLLTIQLSSQRKRESS